MLRAGETVFDLYTDDPALSVRRFALTHRVPALRDRESASVDHYRRLFTRHLRERCDGEPDADLRAAVVGASVVAAHNVALREWLAAGRRDGRDGGSLHRFRHGGRAAARRTLGRPARGDSAPGEGAVRLERTAPLTE